MEIVVSDLYKYSEYYIKIYLIKDSSSKLRSIFSNLISLKVNVSYPFILQLFEDYKNNLISEDEFVEILNYTESYVYRRAICGIPTNSLNKTFATFKKHIDPSNYIESIKARFLLLDSYRRFPRDDEFNQQLKTRDLYNTRSIKYALDKIENFKRKEKVHIDDYTIEHIMPQNPNLSQDWQIELGDDWQTIQEKYLHTVGNLTLTGYNSELSDNSFIEKQSMEGGFSDSPIRLNEGLNTLTKWDEEEIIKRANDISQKAVKIWSIPELEEEILSKYKQKKKQESLKIPHNLIDLINDEPSIVEAPTSSTYIRFKPKSLLKLRERLIQKEIINEKYDLVKQSLFWYEFAISKDRIRFAFLIGYDNNQESRKKVYDAFCNYTQYFPRVDRELRAQWHTVFSKEMISSEEYEMYSDDENLDLFELIELRFHEIIEKDIPKIDEAILSLVE